MRNKKKLLFTVIAVLVLIQFIHPAHNKSVQVLPIDFLVMYKPADSIKEIFKTACYDCHSNNTAYPWYSNIQPIAWVMANHIKNGKEKLNLSEFGNNSTRKQISKLKEISNQVKDNEMPISSYKLMHKNARLSQNEKNMLINWLQSKADSLDANI